MKKLIALLLALVMVVGLVACGAKEETAAPAATEAAPAATEAAKEEAPATEAAPVEEEGTKTIAVIAKGESHAFWQAVKAGAEQAGAEMGYTITFRGPASESAKDIPSQQEMVQTALSSNVDGIVLATIGTGYVDLLTQAYDKQIPVVQFDSGIWADDVAALDAAGKTPSWLTLLLPTPRLLLLLLITCSRRSRLTSLLPPRPTLLVLSSTTSPRPVSTALPASSISSSLWLTLTRPPRASTRSLRK